MLVAGHPWPAPGLAGELFEPLDELPMDALPQGLWEGRGQGTQAASWPLPRLSCGELGDDLLSRAALTAAPHSGGRAGDLPDLHETADAADRGRNVVGGAARLTLGAGPLESKHCSTGPPPCPSCGRQ